MKVENKTMISWRVYHNYHQLVIIDAHEQCIMQLDKHGSLSVRPCTDGDDVAYLMLDNLYILNVITAEADATNGSYRGNESSCTGENHLSAMRKRLGKW